MAIFELPEVVLINFCNGQEIVSKFLKVFMVHKIFCYLKEKRDLLLTDQINISKYGD